MQQIWQMELQDLRESLAKLNLSDHKDCEYALMICAKLVGEVTEFDEHAVADSISEINFSKDEVPLRNYDRLLRYLQRYYDLLSKGEVK